MKREDKQQIAHLISLLEAAMDALAATVSSNHEIVLHNLTVPERSVYKIINGHVSGRKQGDGLLSGPEKDFGFAGLLIRNKNDNQPVVISNYKTQAASGKVLNSASTIYYSDDGEPLMAFCINVDDSPYEQIRKSLDVLATASAHSAEHPEPGLNDLIGQTIQEIIEKHAVAHQKIQKAQRLKIVAEMHARGIFKMKGGVQHVAQALGVTRYTIYNDLEVLGEKQ